MKPRIKYRIIHRHSEEYPVSVMCAFFKYPEAVATPLSIVEQAGKGRRSCGTYRTAAGMQLPHLRVPADVVMAETSEYLPHLLL